MGSPGGPLNGLQLLRRLDEVLIEARAALGKDENGQPRRGRALDRSVVVLSGLLGSVAHDAKMALQALSEVEGSLERIEAHASVDGLPEATDRRKLLGLLRGAYLVLRTDDRRTGAAYRHDLVARIYEVLDDEGLLPPATDDPHLALVRPAPHQECAAEPGGEPAPGEGA